MTTSAVTPEKIMQLTGGTQAAALLGTAVQYELFTRLEAGPMTADEIAKAAKKAALATVKAAAPAEPVAAPTATAPVPPKTA